MGRSSVRCATVAERVGSFGWLMNGSTGTPWSATTHNLKGEKLPLKVVSQGLMKGRVSHLRMLKPRSRPAQGPVRGEKLPLKVLHIRYFMLIKSQRERVISMITQMPLSLVKRQSGKEPLHPAVALYRNAWPDIRLTSKQEAIIRDVVGDRAEHLECWREVIRDYELSPQWKPENLGNMRERLDRKIADRANKANNGGAANGRPPPDNRPSLQPYQAQHARTDPAKFRTAVEEVRKKNGNTS